MVNEVLNNQSVLTPDQYNKNYFSAQIIESVVLGNHAVSVNSEITELANAIQKINASIKELSDLEAAMKRHKAADNNGESLTWDEQNLVNKYTIGFTIGADGRSTGSSKIISGGGKNDDYWDANAQYVDGVLNQLTNLSTAMTNRLKSLTDKVTDANSLNGTLVDSYDKAIQELNSKI